LKNLSQLGVEFSMNRHNLLLTLHNTHSPTIVKFFADTIMGFPSVCKNVIFSKISASAASSGIPDAQKTVLSSNVNGNLYFFSDLGDIIETLAPKTIYLLTSQRFAKKSLNFTQLSQELRKKKVLTVIGGSSPGLTRKELDLGECVYIEGLKQTVNPIALASVFLYGLLTQGSDLNEES
jgi:SpoU rRNA methylase family enzyme